jgi:hypothetical protein
MTLYQRYNWRIIIKYRKREIALAVIAVCVAALVYAGHEYLTEHDLRLTREVEVLDLLTNRYAMTTYGSWTPTDIAEGTIVVDVRRMK